MLTKDIYIFDIDGCIMHDLFSNYEWGESQNIDQVVAEVNKKGKNIKLYPDFELFFKNNCSSSNLILFLTGRKDLHFKSLTEIQLSPLEKYNSFSIIYYPSFFTHDKESYFRWKTDSIIRVLKECGYFYHYHIFDDLREHFAEIECFSRKNNYHCFLYKVSDKRDWKVFQLLDKLTKRL